MKSILIVFCFSICSMTFFGQNKDYFSSSINAGYNYYFLGSQYSKNFNYDVSILLSKYFNKFKISAGIDYSTKYFDSNIEDVVNNVEYREYRIDYLNFPILGSFEIFSKKSFLFDIQSGFIFNRIINYEIKTVHLDGGSDIEENIDENQNLGISLVFGPSISKKIGNFLINFRPTSYFKIKADHNVQRPNYSSLPNDKISLGFNVGLEYLFK